MRDGITGTNLAWFIVAVGAGRGLGFGKALGRGAAWVWEGFGARRGPSFFLDFWIWMGWAAPTFFLFLWSGWTGPSFYANRKSGWVKKCFLAQIYPSFPGVLQIGRVRKIFLKKDGASRPIFSLAFTVLIAPHNLPLPLHHTPLAP